jgi:exopolysaccharide biosynthesis protein
VRFAFQSYPTLLLGDGAVPVALRDGTINNTHRDARLALGLDRQGRLLVAMTRLDVPIPGADRIPFGLTVPEMAAVMGAFGARHAVLLDGGISAQVTISDSTGRPRAWRGLRKVPLALVARTTWMSLAAPGTPATLRP